MTYQRTVNRLIMADRENDWQKNVDFDGTEYHVIRINWHDRDLLFGLQIGDYLFNKRDIYTFNILADNVKHGIYSSIFLPDKHSWLLYQAALITNQRYSMLLAGRVDQPIVKLTEDLKDVIINCLQKTKLF